MHIWLDAHLSPELARWIGERFGVKATSLIEAGMQTLKDTDLFARIRSEGDVIMTKDSDFVELVNRKGPPPQIIHLAFGNTSNAELRRILDPALLDAIRLLTTGERLVEITRRV